MSGVRRSLARLPSATKADKKAFGVGERLSSRSVPQVLAGLDALLAASAERNALGAATAADVDAVPAAASVAFHARPEVAARFEAVVPGTGRKPRKAPAPAA